MRIKRMSFQQLVSRISPKLRLITHKLNGRFTFFNDEDLFQEALIHLWRDFTDNKLSDKTESYILQGCYFYLKNYIRKTKDKKNLISLDAKLNEEGEELEGLLPSTDFESYLEHLNNELLIEKIQNNGLTKREREVLSLCLEGLTTREIGRRIGVSHVMVVKLKSRLKNKCTKFIDFT